MQTLIHRTVTPASTRPAKRSPLLPSPIAVLLAVLPASVAQAVPIVFTGLDDPRGSFTNSTAARAAFLATLSDSGTDDLEAFVIGTFDPTLVFGTTGLTAATDVDQVASGPSVATSGINFLLDRIGDDEFFLSAPVTAFGLDLIDASNLASPTTVTLRLTDTGAGTSKEVSFTFAAETANDNVLFFGVTDADGFDRVTYLNSRDANDGVRIDDVTVGFVVPEPTSLSLLALGGLTLLRRRRAVPS